MGEGKMGVGAGLPEGAGLPTFLPGGVLLRHLSVHHADHPVLPWSYAAWGRGGHRLLHHTQLPQAVRLGGEWPSRIPRSHGLS